jgi:eukaryotic-like serine/threonine-protein kinase
MTITAGTKLGTYEIVGLLGKGGMGEVYRARDSKLKREVAIKILPDAFARDDDRVARFQREAEVLASLNHPHIAAVYDFADVADSRFLVLELVEGETLADRIVRGPIPIKESLEIVKQIAEALEAAHEKGIIHRDLKPANIKLTPDGSAKVLDFGLAKAREPAIATDVSNSPTMISGSIPGMIMGTAGYMSPEQANGKEADRTSDVWAFGCVLYEMLTGQRAFEGSTVTEIFAGILKTDPDWRRLPKDTPENIRRLLRRCLQKDRKLRLRDIGDVRVEIDEAGETKTDPDEIQRSSRRRERLVWSLAVTALIVVAAALAFRPVPVAPEMRVDINTPPTSDPLSLAISPDGRRIVFVATSGTSGLWLRSLDSTSARPLNGTENASSPFWSPDSRSIAFFAEGKLKRLDIDGGSAQTLTTVGPTRGGTWGRDGVILFTPTPTAPIARISATGGAPAQVTRLMPGQPVHIGPHFLPDGNHFLYYAPSLTEGSAIYVGSLDGAVPRRLIEAQSPAVFTSSEHILFIRQGTLFAQAFDIKRLDVTGDPFSVAEQVITMSASAGGPIAYRTGSGIQRQFLWLDRGGRSQTVGNSDGAAPLDPALSPDSRHVALQRTVNGNPDVWLLELERSVLTRFTFDPAVDAYPIWSPDGSRIVFSSPRKAARDLYLKAATGAGNEELLLTTPQAKMATDWSRDGRFLLFGTLAGNADIWALPMDGDRKAFPVVQTTFNERLAQFSPDGKWIAYESNESGRYEVYAQAFPTSGGKWQISTNGGAMARWGRDGKELFYVGLDGRLMSAPTTFSPDGRALQPGTPVALFMTHIGGAVQGTNRHQYMVSPDGQRFLMNTITEEATSPITVILNWRPKS